ncbi:MAG: DUF3050 domain-containing protein [Planctomycetota bacterium]|nr:MAG: DUF3050 domain-containing protein [Planctomycetota bacterium]
MSITRIQAAIEPLRTSLIEHPLYHDMREPAALRVFMECHVFAVWDFMSLVKALQRQLCCVNVPWIPSRYPEAARLINEIVLGEETDEDGQGGYASHFELYRRAMRQFGASTDGIDQLTMALQSGQSLTAALSNEGISPSIRAFVAHTFDVIASGDLCRIASAFTFGREDLLPQLFQRIVDELHARNGSGLEIFQYYLKRHIDLDSGEHGPMAHQLIQSLCEDDPVRWDAVEEAALAALEVRCNLWHSIHSEVLRTVRSSVAASKTE